MGIFTRLRDHLTAPVQPPQTETRAGLVQLVETMGVTPVEPIPSDFAGFVRGAYLDNGIIWAAVTARLTLFAQGEFVIENESTGETRALPPRLKILDTPWPNGTRSEMLARIEQDTSFAGNSYIYAAEPRRWQRLRPDWVDIILDPAGKELVGYWYYEGGRMTGKAPKILLPEEVGHGSPYPHPLKAFAGASWVTSIVAEILGDKAMNQHKQKFFEHGATVNMVISAPSTLSPRAREELETALKYKFGGVHNAYKTLVLEEGADATPVGSDLAAVTFDTVQAAGENRIAVAGQVPSVVLGIKEGAEQATYSNYGQALMHFANFPIRHMWDHTSGTLAHLLPVPAGWRLAISTDNIPALQSDKKQDAEIAEVQATTMRELLDAGFTPESVVEAVTTGDMTLLEHTGLVSDSLDKVIEENGEVEEVPDDLSSLLVG